MRLSVSFAGYGYLDRVRALEVGDVSPAGIHLMMQVVEVTDLFRRMAQNAEFQAAEMSMSTYMMMLSQGDTRLVGIPVFFSRAFRHNMIFINEEKGITRPEDLKGKTVGLLDYQMTAALWVRAFLKHDYGVSPSDIDWRHGGVDTPGYRERRRHRPIPELKLTRIPSSETISRMFLTGELDAILTFDPYPYRGLSPRIRRLFPDYREVERDYFLRTGFFPIMHMLVVQRDLYEANPWVAMSLLNAFSEAKQRGLERLRDTGALAVMLPWIGDDIEELDTLFGGDAFPYGFRENRPTIEAMTSYAYEQGLTERKLEPEELFAPETINDPGDAL